VQVDGYDLVKHVVVYFRLKDGATVWSSFVLQVWRADIRHQGDIGAQGQWCSEIGGCFQPATGIHTNNG